MHTFGALQLLCRKILGGTRNEDIPSMSAKWKEATELRLLGLVRYSCLSQQCHPFFESVCLISFNLIWYIIPHLSLKIAEDKIY